jgi:hypothetical protein
MPVANFFDSSGTFPARSRAGSLAKRSRTDADIELGAAFDLSRDFPPLSLPARPAVDTGELKTLLITAAAISAEVIPVLDGPESPPEIKKIATLLLSFMALLEAVVEKGIVPLAAASGTAGSGATGPRRG